MYNMSAASHYQRVDVESRIATSNPHSLIGMLLDGALKKIAVATGATERGDIALKGSSISRAICIIDNLRAALDHKRGGEVAANLHALYNYMEKRLAEANRKSDITILAEVSSLLNEVKEGWDAISDMGRTY